MELPVVQPAGWKRPRGYANGIRVPRDRDLLFIAGMIGWDENEQLVSKSFPDQFEQALRNMQMEWQIFFTIGVIATFISYGLSVRNNNRKDVIVSAALLLFFLVGLAVTR